MPKSDKLSPVPSSRPSLRNHALTDEQLAVVEYLTDFTKDIQTLGGLAGTGKTTVIKTLTERLPRFAVCAYTGKAANVLRRKGISAASTIHSLIYKPEEVVTWVNGKRRVTTRWIRRDRVPYDGFIVDEASMVSESIHFDLLSYDLPIIYVGDHGQLPPVEGNLNLMTNPDVTLTTIHRNAGEIARFAQFIRHGYPPIDWKQHRDYTGEVQFIDMAAMVDDSFAKGDNQIITAYNSTRVGINALVRHMRGCPADRPVVGDRVICLQNDRTIGVFNGMQGTITAIVGDEMTFLADEDRPYRVRFIPEQFGSVHKPKRDRKGRIPFDYTYAVTCHKAQGDEWDQVLVFEQRCRGWEHARWAYTAASRAREKLVWCAV